MASPNLYPPIAPPPPPPPVYRRRSIAGSADSDRRSAWCSCCTNLGAIHGWQLWRWFGHWWPLLLILWGVIAIIEHTTAYRTGTRPRHLGAGGIVLLVLLVCLGVSAHYSSDVDWSGVRDQIQMDDDLGGIFGTAYTFEDTLEQAFPAHGTLRVVCDRGTLNITPSDGNVIRVVVHKKLYAQNQNDANKYNEGTKPQITVTGNSVLLNANTNGAGEHGVQSDMDI